MIDTALLQTTPLFRDVPLAELQPLARHLQLMTAHPGRQLIAQAQPSSCAFLVLKGLVQVVRDRADGTSLLIYLAGPGDLVGEEALFGGEPSNAVIAVERSVLLVIPHAQLRSALEEGRQLALNFARALARRLALTNDQLTVLATSGSGQRVARLLLNLARTYGCPGQSGELNLPFRLTQSDLGRLTGLARASVNKVMGDFAREGVVSYDTRQRLCVHNLRVIEERCFL